MRLVYAGQMLSSNQYLSFLSTKLADGNLGFTHASEINLIRRQNSESDLPAGLKEIKLAKELRNYITDHFTDAELRNFEQSETKRKGL